MKKAVLALALLGVLTFSGCGMGEGNMSGNNQTGSGTGNDAPKTSGTDLMENAGKLKDGTYTATQDDYDQETGWKDSATVTVKNGEVTAVDWNGTKEGVAENKKEYSKSGQYGMKEKGGAQAEWHEEAALAEKYFVDHKGKINLDYKDGKTDAISGVTIKVESFFKLAEKALEDARE